MGVSSCGRLPHMKKRFRTRRGFAANFHKRVDTAKDDDSRVAGFHDEDIPPQSCGKGSEDSEDNSSAAAEAQAHGRLQSSALSAIAEKNAARRALAALMGRLCWAVPPSFARRLPSGPAAAGARARTGAWDLSEPLPDQVAGLAASQVHAGSDRGGQGMTRRGRRRTRSA